MKNTKQIVILALGIALSFIGVHIMIPIPTGGMIHLGNFFCLIMAFLFGGVTGGVTGGVGMMLADLTLGYGPETFLRTLIAKFLMGLAAGYAFNKFFKHENTNFKKALLGLSIFTLVLSLIAFYFYFAYDGQVVVSLIDKTIKIHILLPISCLLCAILFGAISFSTKKLQFLELITIYASLIGIFVNVFVEQTVRLFFNMTLFELPFDVSLWTSIAKLPAGILNGIITVVIMGLIFRPVYNAVTKIHKRA